MTVDSFYRVEVFAPNELIITRNCFGTKLFILLKGRVQVEKVHKDGIVKVTSVMVNGACFGERSLLFGARHELSIRSLTFCETSTLTQEQMKQVMKEFPAVEKNVRRRFVF